VTVHVRAAEPADVDLVVPLYAAYRAFYQCAPAPADERAFIAERLARRDSRIFVALDGQPPMSVGFVQLYPAFSSLHMRPAWILNDLYVAVSHRGRGVARMLMDAGHALAEETGSAYVTLETAPDNRAAQRLYEALGYRRDDSMLHYVLDRLAPAAR